MKKNTKRSSDILLEIVTHEEPTGELTYRHILQMLGERAFGMVLLFFALPSALPFSAIPGISFIFSVPIACFACQMVFARKKLWLPKVVAKRTIHHDTLSRVIHAAVPYLVKIEYFSKPRWLFMFSRFIEIINGSIIFCLAILLMLPIPLSNFIFAALLVIFSIGLIEKDGLFIVAGYVGAILYIGFIYTFIWAIIKQIFN